MPSLHVLPGAAEMSAAEVLKLHEVVRFARWCGFEVAEPEPTVSELLLRVADAAEGFLSVLNAGLGVQETRVAWHVTARRLMAIDPAFEGLELDSARALCAPRGSADRTAANWIDHVQPERLQPKGGHKSRNALQRARRTAERIKDARCELRRESTRQHG